MARGVDSIRRTAVGVLGAVLLLIGVALLVLPGPGLLLVFAGVVLLARAVPALDRFVAPVRVRAMRRRRGERRRAPDAADARFPSARRRSVPRHAGVGRLASRPSCRLTVRITGRPRRDQIDSGFLPLFTPARTGATAGPGGASLLATGSGTYAVTKRDGAPYI
ncbi:hypothetical protein STENM327S_03314 [Streptomyces tendae]